MAKRSQTGAPVGDRLYALGFFILVAGTPLVWSSEFSFVAYYPKLIALHVGVALLVLSWAYRMVSQPHIGASAIALPLVCYTAFVGLSLFWAINRVEAIVQIAHQIALLLLFFAMLNTTRSQDVLHRIRLITGVGIVVSLIGLIQYGGWGLYWIPSTGFPSSTLGYRNYAAMYALLCIPLSVLLFFDSRQEKSIWAWALGAGALFAFLVATRTRGAWVGLAAALLIASVAMVLLKTHDGKRLWGAIRDMATRRHLAPGVIALTASIAFILLIPPRMEGRGYDRNRPDKAQIVGSVASMLDREKDVQKSIAHRLNMWQNTLDMIADQPVMGVGAGNWYIAYPAYDGGDVVWEKATPRRPHNDYVWIAAEFGLPGLLIYLWLLGTVAFAVVRIIQTQNRSRARLPLFLGTAICALSVHAAFSFPRERIAVSMLFWMLIAFVARLDAEYRPRPQSPQWRIVPIGGLGALILGLLIGIRGQIFDRHFARAHTATARSDWTQVIRETTAALEQGVFDPQAYLLRGVAHANLDNYAQALADNALCLSYHPHFLNALNNMGMYYNAQRKFSDAKRVLQRALQINPDHGDAHANLGITYQGLGNREASVAALERAFAQNPGDAEVRTFLGKAHYSLAEARLARGDSAAAAASYQAFLNIWRGDAQSAAIVRQKLNAIQVTTP